MAQSLAQFFVEQFQARGHECAFRQRRGYRMESFTYRDVLAMAGGFCAELQSRGIRKGDRAMLWGENSAKWVATFWGCVLAGAVVVPMDDGAAVDFACRVMQQTDAKLLIASRRHEQEVHAAGNLVAHVNLEDLRPSAAPTTFPTVELGPGDTLQIVFTSGTTAEPRGVIITHGNVLANIAPVEREMGGYMRYERFVHPLRFLNLLPLSHVFGQFLGMFLPPLLGGTVIFQEELKPSEIVRTICRERVSVLVSVPRVLQSLKQKIERDLEADGRAETFRERFKSAEGKHFLRRWWMFRAIRRQFGWKFWAMISGGAALDRETEEFWGRLGYAVIQGYGLTETTSLISLNHPFRLGKGSIGKVLPGREVKLADDGEILVRGGGVATGYWNGHGGQSVSGEGGWYRTGDIGALDDAGNLYFKGRKKEVVVTAGGMKVYPDDLEAALRKQPEVKDCVVVGIEQDGNAEPCAALILRDGESVADVVARANESLGDYQRVRMWMEWPDEDFPRTSTQKPRRNVIAEIARNSVLAKSQTRPDSSPLTELIARVARRPVPALREDARLDSDLGLGSLDRVELLSALEDRYQVDLSEAGFATVKTVGDLERMLRGEGASGQGYHYPRWVLTWPVNWARQFAQYLLMRPALMLLGWPRIIGREHMRGTRGPLLVVANHITDYDPGFVLAALPARFRHRLAIATGGETLEGLRTSNRGFASKVWDRTRWTLGVSLLNLFPLPKDVGFRRSFAYAGEAVDRGYSVLIFPEGKLTIDGTMHPFRAGVGLLAANLGIPVVPMRIDGLFEIKKAGKRHAAPWKISVRVGKPMRFELNADPARITAELQEAVRSL